VGGALGAAMERFAADPSDAQAAEIISAHPEYIGQVRTTCVATMMMPAMRPMRCRSAPRRPSIAASSRA
jgi:hypothetical protein